MLSVEKFVKRYATVKPDVVKMCMSSTPPLPFATNCLRIFV